MRHFINISEITKKDFDHILTDIDKLKAKKTKLLKNKKIGLIFENYSTRTRLSFMSAISDLGGNFFDIKLEDLNLQRTETIEDTFRIFSCYLDAIIYRTKNHKNLEMAKKHFKKPIINALSDYSHPCQAISDLYTIKKNFKSLKNISISWFGDINNVLLSIAQCMKFIPNTSLNIFSDKMILKQKKDYLPNYSNIYIYEYIDKGVLNKTNCIMTDVFTSMNDKSNRLKEKVLKKFQINAELMDYTKDNCIFMHCLPANIGSEVTEEVLFGKKSKVMTQAENKMHAHRSILKWLNI